MGQRDRLIQQVVRLEKEVIRVQQQLDAVMLERARLVEEVERGNQLARAIGAEVATLRRDVTEATGELMSIATLQREVMQDTAAVSASLAAIQASNTWRVLERYWRMRLRLRGLHIRFRLKR